MTHLTRKLATLGLSCALLAVTHSVAAQTVPEAPTSLQSTVQGTAVHLSWSAPSNGPVPTSYLVEAALSPGGAAVATLAAGTTSIVVPDVPNGTYYARVRSLNATGASAPTSEVVVRVPGAASCTTVPDRPQNVTASVDGMSVALRWTPATGGCPAAGFVVQAGSAAGLSDLAVVNMGLETALSTAAPAGNYHVRVLAINAAGSSPPSQEITFAVGAAGGLYGGRIAASIVEQNGVRAVIADRDGHLGATVSPPGAPTATGAVLKVASGGDITVFTDSLGRPARAVIGDAIVLYANYTATTVDVAVIAPGQPTSFIRGAALPPATRQVVGLLASASAPLNTTLSRESRDWVLAISAATCIVAGIPSAATPAGLIVLSALGCGITAVEVYNRLKGINANVEDPDLVASRTATNHLGALGQCGIAAVRRDPKAFFECASFAAGAAGAAAEAFLGANDSEVQSATRILTNANNPATVTGTWTGIAYAGAFTSTGPITMSFVEDQNGSVRASLPGVQLAGFRSGSSLVLDRIDGVNCEQWQLTYDGRSITGLRWYSCGPLAFRFPINRIELTQRIP